MTHRADRDVWVNPMQKFVLRERFLREKTREEPHRSISV